MPRPLRAAALFGAAALAAHGLAQPGAVPPTYSAFPQLKTPTRPVDIGDGKVVPFPDYPALYARLRARADRPLAAGAPAAEQVRSHQLKAGATFLLTTHPQMRAIGDREPPDVIRALVPMVNDVYAAAMVCEPDAARAALAEERVRVLKEIERVIEAKVNMGQNPPALLSFVRFHRLRAEGDLLALTGGK